MKKFKNFIDEFKKFISRGNVVDLAIGVIVANAFTAIVTALTNKIIMPCINWLLSLGGSNGLESAYLFLKKVYTLDTEGHSVVDLTKSIYIDWGAFITAIINFFLIAFVLFLLLKIFNKAVIFSRELNEKVVSLSKKEIKKLKKQGLTEEEIENAQKIALENAQKNEEILPQKKPTTDELLTEILKVLKEKNIEENLTSNTNNFEEK